MVAKASQYGSKYLSKKNACFAMEGKSIVNDILSIFIMHRLSQKQQRNYLVC